MLDPPDEVAGPAKPGTAVGHRFGLALGAVRAADTVADIVLVTIHWGIELDARPRASQVAQAHRLIDAGADAIFGSHTHTVQPVQTYRGRPIFYSLGNLVWPRLSPAMRTGSIAEVTIGPSGDITARSLPVEVVSDGHPTLVASAPTSGSVVPR